MQIAGKFTIELSAYELVALRDALGILSHQQQMDAGLTLRQVQATTVIWETLEGFLGGDPNNDDDVDPDEAARLNEEELQTLGANTTQWNVKPPEWKERQ